MLSALALVMLVVAPVGMHEARAHEDACVAWGLADVTAPHDVLQTSPTTTSFSVYLSLGACAVSFTGITMTGTISGTCALTTGTGTTGTGHDFDVKGSGYTWVLSGQVTGRITLYTPSFPCEPHLSTTYWATGEVVLTH